MVGLTEVLGIGSSYLLGLERGMESRLVVRGGEYGFGFKRECLLFVFLSDVFNDVLLIFPERY